MLVRQGYAELHTITPPAYAETIDEYPFWDAGLRVLYHPIHRFDVWMRSDHWIREYE